MKTAEDILGEMEYDIHYNADCSGSSSSYDYDNVIKAMKTYANQKLDEAADILRPYSPDGSSIVREQKDVI